MSYESEMIEMILDFEKQINEIVFDESFNEGDADKQQAAEDLKGYLSEIKGLVNDEKEIDIKQKL